MGVYVFQTPAELDRRTTVLVENCSFVKGSANEGGGIALFVQGQCDSVIRLHPSTFLQVSSSRFLLNHATVNTTDESECEDYSCGHGGAVFINFSSNCNPAVISINSCSFLQNTADVYGAGINIFDRTYSPVVNLIRISNHTVFEGGSAGRIGGGIRYLTEVIPMPSEDGSLPHNLINFQLFQTSLSENTAGIYGAALSMVFQGTRSSSNQIPRRTELTNCDIRNNTAGIYGASSILIRSTHSSSSQNIVLTNVSICCQGDVLLEPFALTSVFAVTNMDVIHFNNCSFYNNNQTALVALASNVHFHGTVLFANNQGLEGGALALYQSSIHLHNNTLLVFRDNRAGWHGGGIFIAQRSSLLMPYPCFFQLSTTDFTPINSLNIQILMESNAAPAGSAIYGGSVDLCWSQSVLLDDKGMVLTYPGGERIFDTIFKIIPSKANDTSVISSDGLDVCFCENNLPQCDIRVKNATPTYPGAKVGASLTVVGQRNGTSPGEIGVLYSNRIK